LSEAQKSYVAFGCGDAQKLFLIPYADFKPWLDGFFKTERADRSYWHVVIRESGRLYRMTGQGSSVFIEPPARR